MQCGTVPDVRQIKANKIKWGDHSGEEIIQEMVQSAYADIIGWKKNIFRLPRGKCGSDFIKELTNLINHFVNKTPWQRLALLLVHVFIPLMLQKPSSKSKPRDHTKYLTTRLERWRNGQLKSLMDEAREIQERIKPNKNKERAEKEQNQKNMKAFSIIIFLQYQTPVQGIYLDALTASN